MTTAKLNIAQRLNAVMQKISYIQKDDKEGMKYTIVSHDKVTGLCRPHLMEAGVVYYPRNLSISVNGNRTEAVFDVRFENIDDRTDFIDVATMGFGLDQQDKGPGKALSYGVKYALLKALGLETGDDPDNDQHTIHRSDLDTKADGIENLVSVQESVLDLKSLMEEASVIEIMGALATRNPGRAMTLKGAMSKKMKELKAHV